eukprot:Nk52_evm5s2415 gene=Nk52_evmTU5s2415
MYEWLVGERKEEEGGGEKEEEWKEEEEEWGPRVSPGVPGMSVVQCGRVAGKDHFSIEELNGDKFVYYGENGEKKREVSVVGLGGECDVSGETTICGCNGRCDWWSHKCVCAGDFFSLEDILGDPNRVPDNVLHRKIVLRKPPGDFHGEEEEEVSKWSRGSLPDFYVTEPTFPPPGAARARHCFQLCDFEWTGTSHENPCTDGVPKAQGRCVSKSFITSAEIKVRQVFRWVWNGLTFVFSPVVSLIWKNGEVEKGIIAYWRILEYENSVCECSDNNSHVNGVCRQRKSYPELSARLMYQSMKESVYFAARRLDPGCQSTGAEPKSFGEDMCYDDIARYFDARYRDRIRAHLFQYKYRESIADSIKRKQEKAKQAKGEKNEERQVPGTEKASSLKPAVHFVLFLAGGGLKGTVEALMMQEMEVNFHVALYEVADLTGGTSTGALLGSAVARTRYSGASLFRIYQYIGENVFPKDAIIFPQPYWGSKYGAGITKALEFISSQQCAPPGPESMKENQCQSVPFYSNFAPDKGVHPIVTAYRVPFTALDRVNCTQLNMNAYEKDFDRVNCVNDDSSSLDEKSEMELYREGLKHCKNVFFKNCVGPNNFRPVMVPWTSKDVLEGLDEDCVSAMQGCFGNGAFTAEDKHNVITTFFFKKPIEFAAGEQELINEEFSELNAGRQLKGKFPKQTVAEWGTMLFKSWEKPRNLVLNFCKYDPIEIQTRKKEQESCAVDSIGSSHKRFNPRVSELLRTTSAAPTYFPARKVSSIPNYIFIDGGVTYNSPALSLEREATQLYLCEEEIFNEGSEFSLPACFIKTLSLNCGNTRAGMGKMEDYDPRADTANKFKKLLQEKGIEENIESGGDVWDWGQLQWITTITDVAMDQSQMAYELDLVTQSCNGMINANALYRSNNMTNHNLTHTRYRVIQDYIIESVPNTCFAFVDGPTMKRRQLIGEGSFEIEDNTIETDTLRKCPWYSLSSIVNSNGGKYKDLFDHVEDDSFFYNIGSSMDNTDPNFFAASKSGAEDWFDENICSIMPVLLPANPSLLCRIYLECGLKAKVKVDGTEKQCPEYGFGGYKDPKLEFIPFLIVKEAIVLDMLPYDVITETYKPCKDISQSECKERVWRMKTPQCLDDTCKRTNDGTSGTTYSDTHERDFLDNVCLGTGNEKSNNKIEKYSFVIQEFMRQIPRKDGEHDDITSVLGEPHIHVSDNKCVYFRPREMRSCRGNECYVKHKHSGASSH